MVKQVELSRNHLKELRKRFLFMILALVIFRVGSFIPIPGVNTAIVDKLLEQQHGTIIDIFNIFSGGALSRASIFTLGIMPYISASIIIQLLSVISPNLARLKKEGEIGNRKINQYVRCTTLILSILQSVGVTISLPSIPGMKNLVDQVNFSFYSIAVISLVTGTIFLMWLGEQITERGIGNGISIIMLIGIIASLPTAIIRTIEQIKQERMSIFLLLLTIIFIMIIVYFVIFIERGQRRIPVNYAKHQQGRRIYITQSTHLPLKINIAGVIPAIFASSIVLFPATIASWFSNYQKFKWLSTVALNLQPGHFFYILLYTISIIFFCFFYTEIVFNSRETADNLKKSGAFLPGIRPGEQTAKFINKVITRLTLVGAIYVVFICLIPEFMRSILKVPFYFSGTSLLIVVVVIMDFIIQVQTIMMSNRYDYILKKANLKGL